MTSPFLSKRSAVHGLLWLMLGGVVSFIGWGFSSSGNYGPFLVVLVQALGIGLIGAACALIGESLERTTVASKSARKYLRWAACAQALSLAIVWLYHRQGIHSFYQVGMPPSAICLGVLSLAGYLKFHAIIYPEISSRVWASRVDRMHSFAAFIAVVAVVLWLVTGSGRFSMGLVVAVLTTNMLWVLLPVMMLEEVRKLPVYDAVLKLSSACSEDWRRRLLASLSDCGIQPAPRDAALNVMIALVAMFLTIVTAFVLGLLLKEMLRGVPLPVHYMAYAMIFLFIVAVLSRVRNIFLRRAWQSMASSAEDVLRRVGSPRPILYLRSFRLDEQLARPSLAERFLGTRPFPNTEQRIANAVHRMGPLIAIGRPGEKLPALGAARFYVAHDRWQDKVAEVLKESQFVLWATGTTMGLRWEISHLTENLNPQQLVLWAHPSLIRGQEIRREQEWTKFRETLGDIFPKPLPERLDSNCFFLFDEQWNPIPFAPRISDVFVSRQLSALHQAIFALRLKQPVIGRFETTV